MSKTEDNFVELMSKNNYKVIRCSHGSSKHNNFGPLKVDKPNEDITSFILVQTIMNFIGEKGMPDFYCYNEKEGFFVELKWKSKLTIKQQDKLNFLNDVIGIKAFVVKLNELRYNNVGVRE